jgi:hypothetical protein
MKFETIKDLEKLFKLCRKQGVAEFQMGATFSFKLGDLPAKYDGSDMVDEVEVEDPLENFPDGVLTPEELTFFANGGKPEDNPYRKN